MLRGIFSRRRRCRSVGLVLVSGWSVQYDRCELYVNHAGDCLIHTQYPALSFYFWHEVHDETHFALEWNDIFGPKCKSVLVLDESTVLPCELRKHHNDHFCASERGPSVIRWRTIWRQKLGDIVSDPYPGRQE